MEKRSKHLVWTLLAGLFVLAGGFGAGTLTAQAAEEDTIKTGVYAGEIDLSGMTAQEAQQAVNGYVDSLREVPVTLVAAGEQEVATTAGELGISWGNPQLVEDALQLGTSGNVIARYKAIKDLEHENKVYDIDLSFDIGAINDFIQKECTRFDQKAVNASLKRENGAFTVVQGQTGYKLDVEASIDAVYNYLTSEWDHQAGRVALNVQVQEPKGSAEELKQVKDVLGSGTTAFTSSGEGRATNVTVGCEKINGVTLYPGEELSAQALMAPVTVENGYAMGGSYINGKVVDSIGGGICQVSTTLYNAVLQAELEVTERFNHSMTVSYVEPAMDAAIAQSAGKDFCFVNNTDAPVYIEGFVKNKTITFNIYGKETRPENRKVKYVSEILETINPPADQIYQDPAQPIGYFLKGESAHIGYKSRLWKIVTVDGVEVSKEQVNTSNYKMVPRSATVGVATADPNAYNEMMAAIGTGSIDHVKNVIALLTAQPVNAAGVGEVIENEAPAE